MKRKTVIITIMFALLHVFASAQGRVVKGTIKDSKTNETLPGATVLVEGTTTATSTNEKGEFTINVEGEGKKLIVSVVGYITKAVAADQDNLTIALEANVTLLKETVVTALGISKEKKALGYAVSEVKADEIQKSGESNAIEALASKAAGIQVTSSGGVPGASSKITIRGNQTISGQNQPLIVIDGVPVDNSTNTVSAADNPYNQNLQGVNNSNRALDINPEDIESVTILKGPAAAALYGARAGTGAILYTTKKGMYKKGLGVTYSTDMELSWVSQLPKRQMKYAQGDWDYTSGTGTPYYETADPGPDQLYNTADDVDGGTSRSWGPTMSSLGMTAHDNAKTFFRMGTAYNNNVSIDGGTDNTTYRFSLGNFNQKGVVANTFMKRNTVRLSAEHKMSEKLKVGTSISYANTRTQMPQNGSNLAGVMLGLMRAPASFDISDYEFGNGFNRSYLSYYDNPFYTVYHNTYSENVNRVFGNTSVTYTPVKWLDVVYRLGLDNYSDNNRQVYAVSSNGDDNSAGYGQVNYDNEVSTQINSDLLITARKNFGENIHTSLMLGNNIWHSDFKDVFSRGRNLSVPNFYNLNNAAERYASNSESIRRTYAYFFDGEIDWKSKIFVSVTGRNEWSSTFGSKKNNYFFPSVSTSVIISDLVKLPKWVSFAKIRGAYAESGISPEPYSAKTYYNAPIYTDGYTNGVTFPYLGANGYAISNTLGSSTLQPERVKGQEYGADIRFFEGRVNIDVTYYNQKTIDILIARPIAPSSGYTKLFDNAGVMSNKGWEIVLGFRPVDKENFKWDISMNWAKNKNKVLKLAEGVTEVNIEEGFEEIGSYAIVGQPYGAFYGTKWQYTSDGKLIIDPTTGLPYIDPKSQNLGNPYPDWLGGIRNTLTYKGLSFSFLFDIRKGGKIWNGTRQRMDNVGTAAETEDREGSYVIEGVLSDGTTNSAGYYNATATPNNVAVDGHTYWRNYKGDAGGAVEGAIEDGSWVRLRDIGLSYRIKLKDKIKYIQYVDLSVTGRNMLLFTKYKGVDPETSLTGAGSNLQGFDYFNNPGTKSIFFGMKFGF